MGHPALCIYKYFLFQIENSIAELSNLIKQHDRILSVNGVSLQNVSQQNAADIIKVLLKLMVYNTT